MNRIVIGLFLLLAGIALTVLAVGVAAEEAKPAPSAPLAQPPAPAAHPEPAGHPEPDGRAATSLHQFARVSDRLYRSAQPDTEADFAALAALGIKTIVSVDGARPQVELARKHGMRYVHVPIGYEGIPAAKAAVIAKAVSTYEGPFLFHCHHGKHRGPAACAIAMRFLDGTDAGNAVKMMKDAGTADRYAGLFRDVQAFAGVSPAVLAAIPADLPEAVAPQGFKRAMVDLDQGFERLKAVRAAAWKAPPDHPDVSPKHETTILAEAYREMGRLQEVLAESEAFRALLAEGEQAAWDLAAVLGEATPDPTRAAAAFERLEKNCAACHKDHRDKK